MPVKNSTDPGDGTQSTTPAVKENGDMFPLNLEYIDDADVLTLPDGSTLLVTDEPKLMTSTSPRPIASSQTIRETSKMDMELPTPPEGRNVTNSSSTEEAIKLLRKRQASPPVLFELKFDFYLQVVNYECIWCAAYWGTTYDDV